LGSLTRPSGFQRCAEGSETRHRSCLAQRPTPTWRGTIKRLKDFDTVLTFVPQEAAARALRAQTLVKSGLKKNLTPAIDDFTELVDLDPMNKDFKKSRSEAMKLLVQSENEGDDAKVDTAAVPLRGVGDILNVEKYVRK
jgi:hypothetical protein